MSLEDLSGFDQVVKARLAQAAEDLTREFDGIYDSDPRTVPGARRIDRLSWVEFRAMIHAATTGKAGQRFLFDRLGAEQLARGGIPLWILNGRDLPNLEAAILGRPFSGSRVEP